MLYYKTFFAEYSGETPADVIKAVYEDAKSGTGMSYEQWWQYQKDVWALKYDEHVPDMHEDHAEKKLLEMLVHLGALEETRAPSPAARSRFV